MSASALQLPEPDPSLPSPPFIHIPGIHNFRDIGGYPVDTKTKDTNTTTNTTKSIRKGLVFRCADPTRITADGKAALRALGVRTIFDLRSKPEIKQFGGSEADFERLQLVEGVRRVYVPCFRDEDWSPEALAVRYRDYMRGSPEGFTAAYLDILSSATSSYAHILRHISANPASPFVIHCTAGKDRTGVLAMLLLGIAGCSDEVIKAEYSWTEEGLSAMKEVIVSHLANQEGLGGDRERAAKMVGSKAENMVATLKAVREIYGSVEGYMKTALGFSEEEVEGVRKALVVDAAPDEELMRAVEAKRKSQGET